MSSLYGFKQNLRHVLTQCLEVKYLKYLKSYADLVLLVDFVIADMLFYYYFEAWGGLRGH